MGSKWEDGFAHLKDFIDATGGAKVSQSFRAADGYRLGAWVCRQRNGRLLLSPDRVVRLEALNGWSWDPLADQWEEAYGLLLGYVERTGDARVPSHSLENGFRLGQWVSVQRRSYASGKLAHDRVARLEELVGWVWRSGS